MDRPGKPEAVGTDRGGGLLGADFTSMLEAELIDHVVGQHPQGGGKVESLNRDRQAPAVAAASRLSPSSSSSGSAHCSSSCPWRLSADRLASPASRRPDTPSAHAGC